MGNTASNGKGRLLELIGRFKSVNLAFSKSQQYKALFFFSLLNKLVNTLMFTFPCAVAQRRHPCFLRLVSERESLCLSSPVAPWGECRHSWFPISADRGRKQVPQLKHNIGRSEEMADVYFLRFPFFFFFQIPHLDSTNQDVLVRGRLLLLFTHVQGEHRRYPSARLLWTQEEEKNGSF